MKEALQNAHIAAQKDTGFVQVTASWEMCSLVLSYGQKNAAFEENSGQIQGNVLDSSLPQVQKAWKLSLSDFWLPAVSILVLDARVDNCSTNPQNTPF